MADSLVATGLDVEPKADRAEVMQPIPRARDEPFSPTVDVAVGVGFEPTEPVKAHSLSRRARSAASVPHLSVASLPALREEAP